MRKKILILLLQKLQSETLSKPCTRYNSAVVDCCYFLMERLRRGNHEQN